MSTFNICMTDAFEADPRPTFIIDLAPAESVAKFEERITYRNAAFRESIQLHSMLQTANDQVTAAFQAWSLDAAATVGEVYAGCGFLWTVFTVERNWRVVSGIRDAQCNVTLAKTNTFSADESVFENELAYSQELRQHLANVRGFDWTITSSGPIQFWTQDMCQLLNVMMLDDRPSALLLEPDHRVLQNLNFTELSGKQRSYMLGMRLEEAWPELWTVISESVIRARDTRQSVVKQEQRLFLEPDGEAEEVYFSWSVIPLLEPFNGLYISLSDVTGKKITQRRMATLALLGKSCSSARDMPTCWQRIIDGLSSNITDFPFALLYSMNEESGKLKRMRGFPEELSHSFRYLTPTTKDPRGFATSIDPDLEADEFVSRMKQAIRSGALQTLQLKAGTLPETLARLRFLPSNTALKTAVIFPLRLYKRNKSCLVLGLNPRRPYDDEMKNWITLFDDFLENAVKSVILAEGEPAQQQGPARENEVLASEFISREHNTGYIAQRLSGIYRIVEMALVGIVELLPNGRVLQANKTWFELSGHPVDLSTASEYAFMDCVFEEDLQKVADAWNTLLGGKTITFEMRWKAYDGEGDNKVRSEEGQWILAACVPVIGDDGTILNVTACTTDINAQKRSERDALQRAEALERAKSSEERFFRFAELVPVALYIFDAQRVMQYCNDKFFETMRSPRIRFQDYNWQSNILEEDLPSISQVWDMIFNAKKRVDFQFRLKSTWRSRDGTETQAWVLGSALPDLAEDGSIKAIMGTVTDISHFKWAEDVQRTRVEEALESKRQQEKYLHPMPLTGYAVLTPSIYIEQEKYISVLTRSIQFY